MNIKPEKENGIVLIQIDGLSKAHLQNALKKKRLPFLSKLMLQKQYNLHAMYTGVPSTTPAVQGELFYGIRTIVPSFSFRDHRTKEIRRMYFPEDATTIEKKLTAKGKPLLKNGSSYGNIYSGGALKTGFCIVSFGKERFFKALTLKNIVLNLYNSLKTVFKSILFLVSELFLGIYDFIKGVFFRNDIFQEFKFILSRLAITVLLRDRMKDSVKYDIKQGVEIIYVNFMGYDEHSHRRGPSSGFAHWVLKGIDRAVRDIWKTAQKSNRRDYKVIIFSDHGQENIIDFKQVTGKTMKEAVDSVFVNVNSELLDEKHGIQYLRSFLLGRKIFHNLSHLINFKNGSKNLVSTAIGPIGHVYIDNEFDDQMRAEYAQRLVQVANIPLVFFVRSDNVTMAVNSEGTYSLQSSRCAILGAEHPYLDEVTNDLERVCKHEDAGDFIISGWRPDQTPVSFVIQHGAHGGPGRAETDAFLLKPNLFDMTLPNDRSYYKLAELRQAIFDYLNRN